MEDNPQSTPPSSGNTPAPLESWEAGEYEEKLGAFIGPRWERTYKRKFRRFMEDPSFEPSWNWSAALALPFWFIYRKMYLWFAVFFFVPSALLNWLVPAASSLTPDEMMKPENQQALLMTAAVQLSARLAAGGMANWLLFRRARTAIRVVGMQPISSSDSMDLLRRVGGTSALLTWLLLGVFVVIALAGISGAVPR